jgi:pimeloyl-ACP methyl ester carboxylesterase
MFSAVLAIGRVYCAPSWATDDDQQVLDDMRRLRILGLHGYHGSAEVLRQQLGPLTAALDGTADLVCVDAPALATGDYGWWHAVDDPSGVTRYRGWPRTRTWLTSLCESARFDGVLGFSQGAALAALLVALCACDTTASPRFDFALMVGGFASRDPDHAAAFDISGGIDVPSLHVIGRADTIVSPHASRALASRFRAPVVVEHDGGHVIPGTSSVLAAVAEFVDGCRTQP